MGSLTRAYSCKRPALVTTTFSNSRGGRLRELRLYYINDITFCRSSASEINRYSPNQDAPNDSGQEAGSISPTAGHVRPGKRRRRSDKDNIPAGIRKLPSPPTTLEQAQMEWDLVETVQPGMLALQNA